LKKQIVEEEKFKEEPFKKVIWKDRNEIQSRTEKKFSQRQKRNSVKNRNEI
jgi:hypothetical protein